MFDVTNFISIYDAVLKNPDKICSQNIKVKVLSFNIDTRNMWIKICITVLFFGFAIGKNFDTCPDGDVLYCNPDECQLPDCACAGSEPSVNVKQRPQIVYLTFDDAMTEEFDLNFYSELFTPDTQGNYKFTNPNGCPIRSTFFVCAKSNEYQIVRNFKQALFTNVLFQYFPLIIVIA